MLNAFRPKGRPPPDWLRAASPTVYISVMHNGEKEMLATITGLLGVFVGAIIGNRLAIGRDKRKEFNALADPIRLKLNAQIENNGKAFSASKEDLTILKDHISFLKKGKYEKAKNEYLACLRECFELNENNKSELCDDTRFFKSVKNLLKFVGRL